MEESKQNSQYEDNWIKKNNYMGKFLSKESNEIINKIKKKYMKNLIFSLLFTVAASGQYNAALDFHNQVRNYYDLTPLSYDSNLAYEAQLWAEEIATTDNFSTSIDNYGENIFSMSRLYYLRHRKDAFLEASINWLIDIQGDYSTYNQALYSEASRIGFGIAENEESIYVVAKYDKLYK